MSLKDKKQELEIPRISLMEGKEIKPDLGFQKHHVYYEKDVAAAVKEYEEVINYLHIENEGDAIYCCNDMTDKYMKYVIEFDTGSFLPVSEGYCTEIEVIGNIHENPELMEED